MLNTPSGPITRGAKVPITWETTAPATQPGTLSAIAKSTQNTTVLSDNVDINAKTFEWVVDVSPDTYNLALNDGSGNKFSGPVDVVARMFIFTFFIVVYVVIFAKIIKIISIFFFFF